MSTEIRVPTLGESVSEATVSQWFKKEGDSVERDEPLCELETDKVTVEVPAPASGVLSGISVEEGETVEVGALLGEIDESAKASEKKEAQGKEKEDKKEKKEKKTEEKAEPAEAKQETKKEPPAEEGREEEEEEGERGGEVIAMPAARKLAEEKDVDLEEVEGSGKGGRITKADVLARLEAVETAPPEEAREKAPAPGEKPSERRRADREERVKMTRLRRTIAKRLKDAQNTAAMLTTFNEVDMSAVMALRNEFKDSFEHKHGVRLGFMSFFVKACVQALHEVPAVNAEIDGEEIVYKNYYDIGVAVGTEQGLVVPVVRDADSKGFADIEKTINDLGRRARDGKLSLDELQGGTFTISNGGIYGSLMSTPILNPPQSGILGMHKIEERARVVEGEIAVRPMMYLALSYDHRIVDGRQAVTFLVRVKECIEDPQRLLLDL